MPKLTLSVDPEVVGGAKRYAEAHGTSVSRLVEDFLIRLTVQEKPREPPVLKRLRGSLKGARVGSYRRHLEKKYR